MNSSSTVCASAGAANAVVAIAPAPFRKLRRFRDIGHLRVISTRRYRAGAVKSMRTNGTALARLETQATRTTADGFG
jgi:hypothetical protein